MLVRPAFLEPASGAGYMLAVFSKDVVSLVLQPGQGPYMHPGIRPEGSMIFGRRKGELDVEKEADDRTT